MAEEEEARDTVTAKVSDKAQDIELRIKEAMRSRVSHFKEQADSLTFEGVRRLLEKDMGLEQYALDVHKRFVKQCLLESLGGVVDDNTSKDSGETGNKPIGSKKVEQAESLEPKNKIKEPCSEDEEKMEDSPVMGLLTSKKTNKTNTMKAGDNEDKAFPSESDIKEAIRKRASYINANAENVTMAGLRRTLEEDLGLDQLTLDPYKKFISKELDEVLKSAEVSETKKKTLGKKSSGKASKVVKSEENVDSSDKGDEEDEQEVKPKKKSGPERKIQNADMLKKRKRLEKETKVPGKKRVKPEESVAEDSSDAEDSGNDSEDSNSQPSAAKQVKLKKEASTPAYGKHVEHLKAVIKSCGMSVPPVVYKKVKQVSENKREGQLIKELEEILSREGLSSNPFEKEIKEVRKRKERAKELEGIDLSNIVSTSRRRSTSSYIPPKPKVPVKKNDSDDAAKTDDEDNEDDEDDDDDDDDDNDDDDDEEGGNDEDDGDNNEDNVSQSEEVNEENDEDSD